MAAAIPAQVCIPVYRSLPVQQQACAVVQATDLSYQVPITASRHSMLLSAFDHLHELETKGLDNDVHHTQLMTGVVKIVGDDIGTHNKDEIGAHVYDSDASMIKAGVINVKSKQEIIITLDRKNKKSLIFKKRVLNTPPIVHNRDALCLDLLTQAIDLGQSNAAPTNKQTQPGS